MTPRPLLAIEGSTWINPRGYGRFTRELVRALAASDSEFELVLVLDSGAAAAPDLPPLRRVIVETRRAVVEAAGANSSRSPLDMWRMSQALSAREFDGVLFPTIYSFVPVTSRARVVVVAHDALPETMPELVLGSRSRRWLWRLKTHLACRRADLLATVSEASAREIARCLPVRAGCPIVVLTEGCAAVFRPDGDSSDDRGRVGKHVPPNARYVLYVGGLSPHKRVPDLVDAFHTLASADDHLWLVLAGPVEEDTFRTNDAHLHAALARMGPARQRVVFTGLVSDEDLAALYRRAACVVLPSLGEGFGLPALEAMTSGTPVVLARTPALEELCGEAAAYFDDIADLAPVLRALLESDSRRAALRAAGLARAGAFGWRAAAERLLAALRQPAGAGARVDAPC